jgi:cadmium resistance protein CadD (predicted permease)
MSAIDASMLMAPFWVRSVVFSGRRIYWAAMFSHAVVLTVASICAFAAANIGDLIVLMLFFADQRFRSWQVVLGQYTGVSAVIGLCLLGAGPASHLPHILIRALGIVTIAVGLHKLSNRPPDAEEKRVPRKSSSATKVFAVAGVSFADCGDNLAVFTPLYIRGSAPEKVLITLVFLVLIGAWCGFARFLTRHRTLGTKIRRLGDLIAPWALIGLGLFIMFW